MRSQAEAELLTLIRRAKLPDPEVNVQLHGYEVDFLWRDEGLVVEVDGPAYHSSGSAVRRDREKEAVLARHRLDLVRLLPAQVESEPEVVITRIAGALAIRGRRGRG